MKPLLQLAVAMAINAGLLFCSFKICLFYCHGHFQHLLLGADAAAIPLLWTADGGLCE